MLGYQSMDGVPVTVNGWLLDDVLRGEWGYTGTLVTDWDNVGRMVWEQHIQPDYVHASAAAVRAGNDMVMTTPRFFEGALEAVDRGLVEEAAIDAAVRRILTLKFRLGLFEDPAGRTSRASRRSSRRPSTPRSTSRSRAAPRAPHQRRHPPVRGRARPRRRRARRPGPRPGRCARPDDRRRRPERGRRPHQLGDWAGASGQADWLPDGHPREMTTTVLDGFRALAPEGWAVTHARGADVLTLAPDPEGELFPDGSPGPRWSCRPPPTTR